MLVFGIIFSTTISFLSIFTVLKIFAVDLEPGTPANNELNNYIEQRRENV